MVLSRNLEAFKIHTAVTLRLPLFLAPISAGFPSPADDFIDKSIDLNKHLVNNPSATFYVRVSGDSMIDANIFEGDILVVDRSLKPESGKIVLAILNGEFTVKRLILENGACTLAPENKRYAPIKITKETDFEVWGVVSYIIHKA